MIGYFLKCIPKKLSYLKMGSQKTTLLLLHMKKIKACFFFLSVRLSVWQYGQKRNSAKHCDTFWRDHFLCDFLDIHENKYFIYVYVYIHFNTFKCTYFLLYVHIQTKLINHYFNVLSKFLWFLSYHQSRTKNLLIKSNDSKVAGKKAFIHPNIRWKRQNVRSTFVTLIPYRNFLNIV